MRRALVSPLMLYHYDQDLFAGLTIPEQLDKDILVNTHHMGPRGAGARWCCYGDDWSVCELSESILTDERKPGGFAGATFPGLLRPP